MKASIKEELKELNPEALLIDGFDEALIGISRRCSQPALAVYDTQKIAEILQGEGMTHAEAHEYIDFNIAGAWMGEHTPILLDRLV